MNIASTPVSPFFDRPGPRGETRATERADESGPAFDGILRKFIGDVNDLQRNAEIEIQKMTTGETSDLHQVVIAMEEATLALDLVLEIRNRAIEGYQELMRMQV